MKPEEAIERLKCIYLCGSNPYCEDCEDCEINMAIDALEKQTPKEPIKDPVYAPGIDSHKVRAWYDICPICHRKLVSPNLIGMTDDKYCGECGQAIDWSDKE